METVTRIRDGEQTGTDAFDRPTYGPDVETDIPGALVAPGGSSEVWTEAGRTPIVTQDTVYFPGSWPDITAADRLRVRGVVREVNGTPANWQPATDGGPGGLVVVLKDVAG